MTSFKDICKGGVALVLGGALVAGLSAFNERAHAADQKPEKTVTTKSIKLAMDDRPVNRDPKFGNSFSPIVKRVAPSVVKISVTIKGKEVSQNNLPDDPFFRQFFGQQFQRRGAEQHQRTPAEHGVGSGVIVTKDGYILTNNHVVDGADTVTVNLTDGREFTAKVIGKDPKSDVAVVKIDAKDLPFIEIANSDKIEVGDLALAIGNPFGIGQTVTMGMISAVGRATMGLDYEDFIQTDAAINPGNSGGALVDAEGRLIGINTAIYSRSGGNQGIGFAIPTSLARGVMESLVKYGKVTRGYLGVSIQDVTPVLAQEFKLKDNKGALVGDVVAKGPAEMAGIQSGDVILQVNGDQVIDGRHLKLEMARQVPGSNVSVKILRDGSTKTLDVTVKERPGSEEVAKADTNDSDTTDTLKGVAVGDLDLGARKELSVPAQIKGAVVTAVEPGSAAAEAGLKPGDVITEINRHPVKGADDAVKMTEHAKDKKTLLHIWSENGSRYVVVDESKAG